MFLEYTIKYLADLDFYLETLYYVYFNSNYSTITIKFMYLLRLDNEINIQNLNAFFLQNLICYKYNTRKLKVIKFDFV